MVKWQHIGPEGQRCGFDSHSRHNISHFHHTHNTGVVTGFLYKLHAVQQQLPADTTLDKHKPPTSNQPTVPSIQPVYKNYQQPQRQTSTNHPPATSRQHHQYNQSTTTSHNVRQAQTQNQIYPCRQVHVYMKAFHMGINDIHTDQVVCDLRCLTYGLLCMA